MRYTVVKTNVIDPDITSAEWQRAELGKIAANRWNEYAPAPKTTFRMLRGPEGISVMMHTEEKDLKCECDVENGNVFMDSCMEFFFKPDVNDMRYFNFEFNPAGILSLGIRTGRKNKEKIDIDREVFRIVSVANEGDWTLKFYIPDDFLMTYFSEISPVCKGNFYKCGDGTDHVHYGAWSEIETATPNFHLPDFFGTIVME